MIDHSFMVKNHLANSWVLGNGVSEVCKKISAKERGEKKVLKMHEF